MKHRADRGFTMMEMLVVVAIIAVLVAVAIPTFGDALSKAKIATDEANLRALKSLIVTDHMVNEVQFQNGGYTLSKSGDSYARGESGMDSKSYSGCITYFCIPERDVYVFTSSIISPDIDESLKEFVIER